MEHLFKTLSSASGITITSVVAVALLGMTALLMPRADRHHLRIPVGFLIAHLVLRGLEFLFEEGSAMRKAVGIVGLAALLVCIGRTSVLLVLDVILGRRLDRQLPKIIRDIIQGVVYFVLLLALLRQLGLEPGQLLTTSALLTAVIGLSLQDTLGNLIAGLSVQIQRPFSVGDWIQFDADPKNIGRVVESNWRATTILTLDEIEVVVPNGALAKAALRVYTRPSRVVRRNIFVTASYDVEPGKVHQIILDAVKDAPGVLKEPPPTVVTNNFADSAIEYWLRIFIEQFPRRDIIDGGVRDRIWYAFKRNGISIPFPHRVVHMHTDSVETRERAELERTEDRNRALRDIHFLKVIGDDQRRELASRASTRLFSRGETIVRQGEDSAELFLILRGETAVVLQTNGVEKEITRLGPGKFFGEMALLTGERRKATVKALHDCELLVIDHNAFKSVLDEQPEVVEALSRVLAERQIQLDEHAASLSGDALATVVQRESSQLLGKIKRLFKLS
ncbi:MAG: mechanosensitive ion channel [Polyangiaceae bacterium]|nr:mechanosensitive ion channel [Polyangiaceae bacterium]